VNGAEYSIRDQSGQSWTTKFSSITGRGGASIFNYQSLNWLYERLLPSFAECLNALHNEEHSIRYWRTIVSAWLCYFIQTLYDLYLSIRHAIDLRVLVRLGCLNGKRNIFNVAGKIANSIQFICR
jgi:putative transferase (TIGR04331 family)